jgi:hypothetical protein
MRTEKQIQASRLNGAKSRGPVTAAGKAKSSRNSLRHGFRSKDPIAALGDLTIDPTCFAEIIAGYASTYDLSSPADLALIEALAHIEALLFRLLQIETENFTVEMDRLAPQHPEASDHELRGLAFQALADKGFWTIYLGMQARLCRQQWDYVRRARSLRFRKNFQNDRTQPATDRSAAIEVRKLSCRPRNTRTKESFSNERTRQTAENTPHPRRRHPHGPSPQKILLIQITICNKINHGLQYAARRENSLSP